MTVERGSWWMQWDRHLGTFRAGIGDDVSTVRGHSADDYVEPESLAILYEVTLTVDEIAELNADKLAGQS